MFNKPNPTQNFYDLETQILNWWKENQILEKSIAQRPEDHSKTFYDGPITANGEPHTGHMLTFSLKDIIPRYWTMKGYRVPRSLGWDCHGIPVEYEVEKKLGFQEKKDIEKFGIAEFNKLCKESVEKYKSSIVELEEKVGRLTNADEEYATMDKDFIESVWWSLKELYIKGFLYEGFKVVPYSTRAGTTLSNAEVALGGYKKIVDPAITVEFPLKEDPKTILLAWTTTPWTIPTNLGLAVGKEIKYARVKRKDSDKIYIVAEDLLKQVFKEDPYEIVGTITAAELVGKEYTPPFDFFVGRKNAHKIYEGLHVTTDAGTGIVHLAPYGAEDNEIFQKVDIESFDVLDEQGDFTETIPTYAGQNYRTANPAIVEDLKKKNLLFRYEDYEHDMPMCWRTKTPLIYKPITSWFIGMSTLRNQLVDNNNKINWVPNHAKEGRFGNWLSEIKDWAISRKRYWGTPLPVWKSDSGKTIVIGSYEELKKLSGIEVEDPHRPFIDDVTFEKDGETYKRITDVIDVWYDSGAMPFARLHYPFENKEAFKEKFPAEYIAEGIDQTRGWFYSLHAIGTALLNSNAFQNVIINGTIVDAQKRKLSKSLGNYSPPLPTIEKFGADTIRMNFFSTPLMYGEDTTIDDKTLKETKQELILPLWNIFSYLTNYANLHRWEPTKEFVFNERTVTSDDHPWDHIPFDNVDNSMDAWILLKLQNTIKEVTAQIDSYNIPKASVALRDLIHETSKWYIRSSRERFVTGDIRAIETLYYVLVETLKLLAPFAPFTSEFIYRELVVEQMEDQKESIHLTDYPVADEKFIENYTMVATEMDLVRRVCEMGHVLRTENKMKVRQPLAELQIVLLNDKVPVLNDWMVEIVKNELNVKEVNSKIKIESSDSVKTLNDEQQKVEIGLNIALDENLKTEGLIREIVRLIQDLRKKSKFRIGESIEITYLTNDAELSKLFETNTEAIKSGVTASSLSKIDNSEAMTKLVADGKEFFLAITKGEDIVR